MQTCFPGRSKKGKLLKTRKEDIREYVLYFAEYDKEPLYILVSGLVEHKVCKNPLEAAQALLDLVREGYLTTYLEADKDGDAYEMVEQIDEDAFLQIVRERKDFEKHPKDREFFFKTSEKGLSLIDNLPDLISKRESWHNRRIGQMFERHFLTTEEGKSVWKHPHWKRAESRD
jgi:hypothetical protein